MEINEKILLIGFEIDNSEFYLANLIAKHIVSLDFTVLLDLGTSGGEGCYVSSTVYNSEIMLGAKSKFC